MASVRRHDDAVSCLEPVHPTDAIDHVLAEGQRSGLGVAREEGHSLIVAGADEHVLAVAGDAQVDRPAQPVGATLAVLDGLHKTQLTCIRVDGEGRDGTP